MKFSAALVAFAALIPTTVSADSESFDTDSRILLENSTWAFVKTAPVWESASAEEATAARTTCAARTNAITFAGSATTEQIITFTDGAPVGHREFVTLIRLEGEAGSWPSMGLYATAEEVQPTLTVTYDAEGRVLIAIELNSETATFYAQCD